MSGHLADPKVGRLGDGTYLLTANRAEVADKGMLVFSSQNLTDWTLIHQVRENEAWFDQGFVGSFVTLDDGSVRMFYISRQMAIASATTPDGITWTRDPDWLIDQDDFGREVAISTLSVIPRTEGGWRMYILVEDCTLPNMQGSLHCQDEGGPPPPKETIAYTLVSAVSDDMLNWHSRGCSLPRQRRGRKPASPARVDCRRWKRQALFPDRTAAQFSERRLANCIRDHIF